MSLMEIPSCYCKFADGKRLSSRLLLMLVDANGRMLAKTRTELRVIKETLITFNFKQMVHLWLKARLFHIHIFLNRSRSKQTSRLVFKVFSKKKLTCSTEVGCGSLFLILSSSKTIQLKLTHPLPCHIEDETHMCWISLQWIGMGPLTNKSDR